MRKIVINLCLVLIICLGVFGAVSAADQGEYPRDLQPAYENNKHGIVGPAKFFIWDAPLFYSENYSKVMKWEVDVHGGDLGYQILSFYTNPFSLYWDRAFYRTNENGEQERILAPIGTYLATITAIGGGDREIQAQRDVEIVIPDPAHSDYQDWPDVYWPKTGADLKDACKSLSMFDCMLLHIVSK